MQVGCPFTLENSSKLTFCIRKIFQHQFLAFTFFQKNKTQILPMDKFVHSMITSVAFFSGSGFSAGSWSSFQHDLSQDCNDLHHFITLNFLGNNWSCFYFGSVLLETKCPQGECVLSASNKRSPTNCQEKSKNFKEN